VSLRIKVSYFIGGMVCRKDHRNQKARGPVLIGILSSWRKTKFYSEDQIFLSIRLEEERNRKFVLATLAGVVVRSLHKTEG
jgi:hypothetical protein